MVVFFWWRVLLIALPLVGGWSIIFQSQEELDFYSVSTCISEIIWTLKVVFSNAVGVLFFSKRIQAEGYESLNFLSQKFEHLLTFRQLQTLTCHEIQTLSYIKWNEISNDYRPIELGFFIALMVINLLLLPLMYFVQLIRQKKKQADECIPNPHLVVTNRLVSRLQS